MAGGERVLIPRVRVYSSLGTCGEDATGDKTGCYSLIIPWSSDTVFAFDTVAGVWKGEGSRGGAMVAEVRGTWLHLKPRHPPLHLLCDLGKVT